MNAQIVVRKNVYPKSDFRPAGTAFSSTITFEGIDGENFTGLHRDGNLVSEIHKAIKRVISVMVYREDEAADLTITLPAGYVLSAALKQHFVDSYVIEPEINSITFA